MSDAAAERQRGSQGAGQLLLVWRPAQRATQTGVAPGPEIAAQRFRALLPPLYP